MMLPPFRIRDLYGQARHGVVQITMPQYDSTLKSHPDAALRYLDEYDGETITVGSGFELSQRLEDPVPPHKAATADEAQVNDYSATERIHTFDIERTSHSVAAWMDHEAYSSKSLRSLSPSSKTSANDAHRTDSQNLGSFVQVAQPAEMIQSHSKPVHTSASGGSAEGTELDMYEEMYDKEVQTTMPTSTEADVSAQVSDAHLPEFRQEPSDTVEKIVSDAMEGFASNLDSHIDTLADFLQNTSKALRVVAEKTRESDTSAVESILSGFNAIFGEVGKLAKAVLDTAEAVPAASPVELDLPQIHETFCNKGKAKEGASAKSNELSASVEVVPDIVDLPSPVLASTPRPIVRVETLPAQQWTTSPAYHSGTEITARLPISQLDKLYHIPSKSFVENQPQEVSAGKDQIFANLERGGFNPDSDRTWKYMPLSDDDHTSKTKKKVDFALPSGTLRPRETAKSSSETFPRSILDLEASDPDFSARFPPLMSVRRSKTMESLRQRSQSPDNRMRSRQDALKRFPSLGQLERRKGKDFYNRNRKEDNARQETIPERAAPEDLPHDAFNQRPQRVSQPDVYVPSTWQWKVPESPDTERDINIRTENPRKPVSHMHRAWFDTLEAKPVEAVNGVFTRQSDEVEEVIAAVGRDIAEASNEVRRLPGAWPEALVDSKTALSANESSGAFFNRMTGQAASSDKRQSTASDAWYNTEWPLSGYRDHRAKHKVQHLERAKSMATLNPSATLTTPFDPLISSGMVGDSLASDDKLKTQQGEEQSDAEVDAGFEAFFDSSPASTTRQQSGSNAQQFGSIPKEVHDQFSSKQDGLRRSATEKMPHRRPYSHRYSGAGRLPWENFEDRSFDLRTGSFVQRHERARRATDRPAPPRPAVNDAAIRQWNIPETSTRKPSINSAARKNQPHPIKLPSDLHQRVNDYRTGVRHRASLPAMGLARQSKINDCIQQLKDMGFGKDDRNEANRLSVYAAATGGDIFEAVEMIEEDRKAAASLRGSRQTMGPENGPGGWL